MTHTRHRDGFVYYGNHLGSVTREDAVRYLYAAQGATCILCGRYMRRESASIDHMIPRSLGGPHDPTNWALAHRSCNHRKSDSLPGPGIIRRFAAIQNRLAINYRNELIARERRLQRPGWHRRVLSMLAKNSAAWCCILLLQA